ncbi:hypothetical protein FVER14953_20671 [Fusarium verticillioides]|nr:hypothetical protein FVER14953_20671 [Fusarium verticillioides]
MWFIPSIISAQSSYSEVLDGGAVGAAGWRMSRNQTLDRIDCFIRDVSLDEGASAVAVPQQLEL